MDQRDDAGHGGQGGRNQHPDQGDPPWSPPRPSVATRRPSARSRFAARVTVVSPEGRQVLAESDTEAKAAYALLAHPGVAALREQPAAVGYFDGEGRHRFHTFDFIAILDDGTRVAVMVKPKALAERRDTAALLRRLAAQVPKSVADRFVLLTEEDVGGDRAHDGKLINAARLHPDPVADAAIRDAAAGVNGPVSVEALMGLAGTGGAGFRAIARLIGSGWLVRLGAGRIGPGTLVEPASRREAGR